MPGAEEPLAADRVRAREYAMSATASSGRVPVFARGKSRRRAAGLRGHLLEAATVRAGVAEAAGTFFLVLTIISTAVAAALAKPVAGPSYGSLAVPLHERVLQRP